MSVMTAIAMAIAGYFQERGFVAIGDARVPSSPIAWIAAIFSGILGVAGGGSVPWKTWLSTLIAKLKTVTASSVSVQTEKKSAVIVTVLAPSAVDWVPEKVAHIDRCIYHLRRVLSADEEAQDYIDKIAVKVGRITSSAAVVKPVVETEVVS